MFDDDESERTEPVTEAVAVEVDNHDGNPDEVPNPPETLNEAPSNDDTSDSNHEVTGPEVAEESDLNRTADDFVEGTIKKVSSDEKKSKNHTKSESRKMKKSFTRRLKEHKPSRPTPTPFEHLDV